MCGLMPRRWKRMRAEAAFKREIAYGPKKDARVGLCETVDARGCSGATIVVREVAQGNLSGATLHSACCKVVAS